jgi:(p)ppGpp synthase/HD superfamily hydrolase
VEDTETTVAELRKRFGEEIAATVDALTEDPAISGYHPRKEALRRSVAAGGADACAVYAADKVAKVRELRTEVAQGVSDLHGPKLTHYEHSLAMLEAHRPGHPLVEQLRFELELLEALPPR